MPSWQPDNLKGALAPLPSYTTANGKEGEDVHLLVPTDIERQGSARLKRLSHELGNMRKSDEPDDDHTGGYADVDLAPKKDPNWIILPQSGFRRVWVLITLVVAFYIIWVTPIRVGFDMQAQGPWFWIEGIIDIFFYIDLVLNFFTAYENPVTGELITDHKMIAKRYLSTWFWIDLLATFPSDYIVKGLQGTWGCSFRNNCDPHLASSTAVSVIVMLRLMRVFRIIWIFKNFSVLSINTLIGKLQDEFLTVRWMFSIGELLVVLIFLGHLTGCFFYMFGHPKWQTPVEKQMIAEGELTPWVVDKTGGYELVQLPDKMDLADGVPVPGNRVAQDLKSGDWYECPHKYFIYNCTFCKGMQLRCRAELGWAFRYITSMYWAYTTMTTVGYGDIVGVTVAEKVWAMITMVIGGFFLSFCFGRIASIVSRLDADRAARGEQMEEVTQFLKDHELPKPVSRRVVEFFKSNVKGVKPYDRAAMLMRMPFDMRSKILQHLYDTCIKNIPLLHKICQEDHAFMTDFTIRLQPYHISSDTFVYQQGEMTSDMYILVRGDVHIVDLERGTPLVKVPEGTIFGEAGLVRSLAGEGKTKRAESVKCDTPCTMLRLALEDAMELCEVYPELAKGLAKLHRTHQHQLQSKDGSAMFASASTINMNMMSDTSVKSGQTGTSPKLATGRASGEADPDVAALKVLCQELQAEVSSQRQILERLPASIAAQLKQPSDAQ